MEEKHLYDIRRITDLRDLLHQSVELFGDKAAFSIRMADHFEDKSYKAFEHECKCIAQGLCDLGLKNEKIGICSANCYEWCCTYLAITNGTGIVVPLDKELPNEEKVNLINRSEAKAVICDKQRAEEFLQVKSEMPDLLLIVIGAEPVEGCLSWNKLLLDGENSRKTGKRDYENHEIDREKMSILLFTSGTTGFAKGVMLSQKNICSDLMCLSSVVKIYPEDKLLSILPLHHTYECSLSFLMLMYCGGCIAFCRGLKYAIKDMQEVEPTIFVTVPLMLEKIHKRIMRTVSKKTGGKLMFGVGKLITNISASLGYNIDDVIFAEIKKNFGGKLRMIITGAAAIDPQVVKDFKTFGIPVYVGYGLTECSPLVIGNNDEYQDIDSVGTPLPGVTAKIDTPDDDGVGEVLIKGPMVMIGYYRDDDATREVFTEDGFFRTGDLAKLTSDGHYKIVGRKKNVIVTENGKNVYPEEVEYYLNGTNAIAESLVMEKKDKTGSTSVIAKILPDIDAIMQKLKTKETPSPEQIESVVSDAVKEANKKMPKYKRIKDFVIKQEEFVRTTTQKIKRFAEEQLDKKENQENKENEHSK